MTHKWQKEKDHFAAGGKVQWKWDKMIDPIGWRLVNNPDFGDNRIMFRIKPEDVKSLAAAMDDMLDKNIELEKRIEQLEHPKSLDVKEEYKHKEGDMMLVSNAEIPRMCRWFDRTFANKVGDIYIDDEDHHWAHCKPHPLQLAYDVLREGVDGLYEIFDPNIHGKHADFRSWSKLAQMEIRKLLQEADKVRENE